jgi:hypothetical protein
MLATLFDRSGDAAPRLPSHGPCPVVRPGWPAEIVVLQSVGVPGPSLAPMLAAPTAASAVPTR